MHRSRNVLKGECRRVVIKWMYCSEDERSFRTVFSRESKFKDPTEGCFNLWQIFKRSQVEYFLLRDRELATVIFIVL